MNRYAAWMMGCLVAGLALAQDVASTNPASASPPSPGEGAGTSPADDRFIQSGEIQTVKVGQQVGIRMPSNPTTGYGWKLARPVEGAVVALVTNVYERAESSHLGSGGHDIWTFKALAPGRERLEFHYLRAWEKGVPPARTNVLTIIVSP